MKKQMLSTLPMLVGELPLRVQMPNSSVAVLTTEACMMNYLRDYGDVAVTYSVDHGYWIVPAFTAEVERNVELRKQEEMWG